MRRSPWILATTLLLALSPAAAWADDDEPVDPTAVPASVRASAFARPSIVYLQATATASVHDATLDEYLVDDDGDLAVFDFSAACTGFVVGSDGLVATAGHCVDATADVIEQAQEWAADEGRDVDADDLRVEAVETEDPPEVTVDVLWSMPSGDARTGTSYTGSVVAVDPFDSDDVALVRVEDVDGVQALPVLDSDEVEDGTGVVSVGYPGSVDEVTDVTLVPSFKSGQVSSSRTVDSHPVYEVDAAISEGMSGGPTVTADGAVVGVNSFKINPTLETQSFNFVRPTSVLVDLMQQADVTATLGPSSEQFRDGLAAYFEGDREAAVTALEAVTEAEPGNEVASRYLAKARGLPSEPDEPVDASPQKEVAPQASTGGGFDPQSPLVIGGGVALALLVLAVALVVHGRRPGPVANVNGPAVYGCPSCGAGVPARQVYCGNCGRPMPW